MHFSRPSIPLLLATACLFFKPVIPMESTTTCSEVHRLSCVSGVVSVQAALYGRADRVTCSEGIPAQQLVNTQCSLQGTTQSIKRRCDGKSICELSVNDVRTSDPCPGINKYLQTNYTCQPAKQLLACEHSLAHLSCDVGQVIFVYGADYGRRDRTTCSYRRPESQIANVYCSSVATKVAERCNGKNNCTIRAGNSVFGDPCVGIYKYLEVAYVCEYPAAFMKRFLHKIHAQEEK